jgi:hypothetical protein
MEAGGDKRFSARGERLVEQVIDFGINGGGPITGAAPVAEEHLIAVGGDREEAVRRMVATHVRLAARPGL